MPSLNDERSHPSGLRGPTVARSACAPLGSRRAEADDLVQDTLLAAWTQPPSERAGLRPWLATVLRNRLRNRLRMRVRGEARRSTREPAHEPEGSDQPGGGFPQHNADPVRVPAVPSFSHRHPASQDRSHQLSPVSGKLKVPNSYGDDPVSGALFKLL